MTRKQLRKLSKLAQKHKVDWVDICETDMIDNKNYPSEGTVTSDDLTLVYRIDEANNLFVCSAIKEIKPPWRKL